MISGGATDDEICWKGRWNMGPNKIGRMADWGGKRESEECVGAGQMKWVGKKLDESGADTSRH